MKSFSYALVSALALSAAANPLPGALRYSIGNRAFYAQYSGASYCNSEVAPGSIVTCSENVCPKVTAAGARVVATFGGEITDIQGFVSSDDTNKVIVVSFQGSTSIRNWITDFEFIQVPCDLVDGCLIHLGFKTAYDEIEEELLAALATARGAHPNYRIIFTGHSLGGAVATVAAGYVRSKKAYAAGADVYSYGSPRVGNNAFVKFVTAQAGGEYRVTHQDDPVPRLPPLILNYRHTSPEYWLESDASASASTADFEIKVCGGFANTDCNGGTSGLDTSAHSYYFEYIGACGESGTPWKERRDVTRGMATTEHEDVSDEELRERLNDWAAKDREFAAGLQERSSS
ncbi:hypothetical protein AAE478_004895 [Parahypoxylon ruwenzoriense]